MSFAGLMSSSVCGKYFGHTFHAPLAASATDPAGANGHRHAARPQLIDHARRRLAQRTKRRSGAMPMTCIGVDLRACMPTRSRATRLPTASMRGSESELAGGQLIEHDGYGSHRLCRDRRIEQSAPRRDGCRTAGKTAALTSLTSNVAGRPPSRLNSWLPRVARATDRIASTSPRRQPQVVARSSARKPRVVSSAPSFRPSFISKTSNGVGIESRRPVDGEACLPCHGQRKTGEPHRGANLHERTTPGAERRADGDSVSGRPASTSRRTHTERDPRRVDRHEQPHREPDSDRRHDVPRRKHARDRGSPARRTMATPARPAKGPTAVAGNATNIDSARNWSASRPLPNPSTLRTPISR